MNTKQITQKFQTSITGKRRTFNKPGNAALPEPHCEFHFLMLHPHNIHRGCPCKGRKKHCMPPRNLSFLECLMSCKPTTFPADIKFNGNKNIANRIKLYRSHANNLADHVQEITKSNVIEGNQRKLVVQYLRRYSFGNYSCDTFNSIFVSIFLCHASFGVSSKQCLNQPMNATKKNTFSFKIKRFYVSASKVYRLVIPIMS